MAQRHRQSICDVGRLGQFPESQFFLDRTLNLPLRGTAVAGQDFFDLRGAIVHHGNTSLGRSQADHAAGMPHQDRRPRTVVMRVELLQGHRCWPQRSNHLGQAGMNLVDPIGQRIPAAPADNARFTQFRPRGGDLQHAIARDVQPGIDAEDSSRRRVSLVVHARVQSVPPGRSSSVILSSFNR